MHWNSDSTGSYKIIIWAPSGEFVSSSIPSWQILTAHAQPFRGARDLAFCLKVPLDSLLVWASSEGSGETARMRRLAWIFAARIGDKYQIGLTRSIYVYFSSPGKISWARQLFRHIQDPMEIFQQQHKLLDGPESKKIIKNYNKLAKVLLEFEVLYHRGWLRQVQLWLISLLMCLLFIVCCAVHEQESCQMSEVRFEINLYLFSWQPDHDKI